MSPVHNEFMKNNLMFEDLNPNPLLQFSHWLEEYLQLSVKESVTMSFSTINLEGYPSIRTVFMREYNSRGFVFFTNYDSNKGEELKKDNRASILFYWPELERQVRIWGRVEKVEKELSDEYFKNRPKGSQAGAWVSRQSDEIKGRESLEKMHGIFLRNVGDKIIPRPEFWGGYRLSPIMYEFWQGRENRLHDRFLYKQIGENWEIKRLAP